MSRIRHPILALVLLAAGPGLVARGQATASGPLADFERKTAEFERTRAKLLAGNDTGVQEGELSRLGREAQDAAGRLTDRAQAQRARERLESLGADDLDGLTRRIERRKAVIDEARRYGAPIVDAVGAGDWATAEAQARKVRDRVAQRVTAADQAGREALADFENALLALAALCRELGGLDAPPADVDALDPARLDDLTASVRSRVEALVRADESLAILGPAILAGLQGARGEARNALNGLDQRREVTENLIEARRLFGAGPVGEPPDFKAIRLRIEKQTAAIRRLLKDRRRRDEATDELDRFRAEVDRAEGQHIVATRVAAAARDLGQVEPVGSTKEAEALRRRLDAHREVLRSIFHATPGDDQLAAALRDLDAGLERLDAIRRALGIDELTADLGKRIPPIEDDLRAVAGGAEPRPQRIADAADRLARLADEVDKLSGDLPAEEPRIDASRRLWEDRRTIAAALIEGADPLYTDLARILEFGPLREAAVEPFDARGALIAVDRDRLNLVVEALREVGERTGPPATSLPAALEPVRRRLQDETGRLQAATERLTAIDGLAGAAATARSHLDDADRALRLGDLVAGRMALLDAAPEIESVETRAAGPLLRDDARFAGLTAADRRHREQLDATARHIVHDRRRAAGWIALPIDSAPLVPPTAENRLLTVELLSARRPAEARAALAGLADTAADPRWGRQVADLRDRLDLDLAARDADAGRPEAAFEALDRVRTRARGATAEAAASAAQRLAGRLARDRADRSSVARGTLFGLIAAVPLAVLAVDLRRRSAAGRRARVDRLLRRAAALSADDRRQLLLRAGEELVALPADLPDVHRLRDRLRRLSVPPTEADPRPDGLRLDWPATVADPVDYADIAHPGADPQAAVQSYLDALADGRLGVDAPDGGQPRKQAAWLRRCLDTAAAATADELAWRAEAARRTAALLPGQTWPLVAQIRAYYRLGDPARALAVASALELRRVPATDRAAIGLLIGRCYLELGDVDRAAKMFKRLEKHPEARRWLDLTAARIAATDGGSKPADAARLALIGRLVDPGPDRTSPGGRPEARGA